MISECKAVVFDMDGTLIESMYAWRSAFIRFANKYDLEMPEALYGVPESTCDAAADHFLEMLAGRMTREEIIDEMIATIDGEYATRVRPRTDIFRLLDRLREKGYILAVATATPMKYARTALVRLGFEPYFEMMLSPDEIGCGKWQPEFFVRVAEKLGVKPEECVMFEDALYAARSAKKAGMHVCAIEEYYSRSGQEGLRWEADRYIACYADLLDEME